MLANFVPFKIGRYLISEPIAVGTMAEIFLAKNLANDGDREVFVVKRILPGYLTIPDVKKMLQKEAAIGCRLDHPNIAKTIELIESPEGPVLVVEYIAGKNLRQVEEKVKELSFPLPAAFSVYVAREICKALEYFHPLTENGQPLGLIHRDISPQNIMISYRGKVKLIDFGVGKMADQSTMTKQGILKGKLAYMSPEQAQGKDLDAQTDIFSLGLTLYELLTGRRAYEGKTEIELFDKARAAKIDRPSKIKPEISSALDSLLSKALSREKTVRFKTAAEFGDALESHLATYYQNFGSHEANRMLATIFKKEMSEENSTLRSGKGISFHAWPSVAESSLRVLHGVKRKLLSGVVRKSTRAIASQEVPPKKDRVELLMKYGIAVLVAVFFVKIFIPSKKTALVEVRQPTREPSSPVIPVAPNPTALLAISRTPGSVPRIINVDWFDASKNFGDSVPCDLSRAAEQCEKIQVQGFAPYTVVLSVAREQNSPPLTEEQCKKISQDAKFDSTALSCRFSFSKASMQIQVGLK